MTQEQKHSANVDYSLNRLREGGGLTPEQYARVQRARQRRAEAKMSAKVKAHLFSRLPKEYVRERTPEEESKARMWRNLGMAAGVTGGLWILSKKMKAKDGDVYKAGVKPFSGTWAESPSDRATRKAADAKDRADALAAAKLARQAEKEAKKATTRGVREMHRNILRAVRHFNIQGVDGRWMPSLDPLASARKGMRIMTGVRRVGDVAEDTGDVVAGRPRQPNKKRFWEKKWFQNAVIGGGLIGGGIWLKRQSDRANFRPASI
jgi:hypothetical protein